MTNFNFRFILKTIGFLLMIESLLLLVCAVVSSFYHEKSADVFLISASVSIISGLVLRLLGYEERERPIGNREGFLVVTLAWAIMSAFGMLPLYLSGSVPTLGGAYFETMSGFTTTGSTVLTNIDTLPHGILLWRCMTQWIGGIGIVVFALAFLPMVGGNASFLYDAETTGITRERFQPRVAQIAKRLWGIYILLTLILVLLLCAGPMNLFESVCHAMSTTSTGGFSTKQANVAHWNSPYVEYIISLFMFTCGVNFALLYFVFKGKPKKLFIDEEFRWYTVLFFIFVLVVATSIYFQGIADGVEHAFRTSLFQVTSAITTTGFCTADFLSWGAFNIFIICFVMLFCACVGSTSGGMKIIRLVVLSKNAVNQFKLQVHPNAILPVSINGRVLPVDIVTKILAFIFLYLAVLIVSFLVLAFAGISFEESITASISSMSNVGLGGIGPTGTFADIPEYTKWFLSFIMLIGRLELFTVLSLFMPAFWRR